MASNTRTNTLQLVIALAAVLLCGGGGGVAAGAITNCAYRNQFGQTWDWSSIAANGRNYASTASTYAYKLVFCNSGVISPSTSAMVQYTSTAPGGVGYEIVHEWDNSGTWQSTSTRATLSWANGDRCNGGTSGPKRTVHIAITCDRTKVGPDSVSYTVTETGTCDYTVAMRHIVGCPLTPEPSSTAGPALSTTALSSTAIALLSSTALSSTAPAARAGSTATALVSSSTALTGSGAAAAASSTADALPSTATAASGAAATSSTAESSAAAPAAGVSHAVVLVAAAASAAVAWRMV